MPPFAPSYYGTRIVTANSSFADPPIKYELLTGRPVRRITTNRSMPIPDAKLAKIVR